VNVLKRILVPGLFGIAMDFAVLGGEYSVFDTRTARAEQADGVERLEVLRAVNDSLRAWADLVEIDPAAIERLARERLGMIRTGEVLYRFADPAGELAPRPGH
jgi:cell division protein FtsB